jgi:hypothetical protein
MAQPPHAETEIEKIRRQTILANAQANNDLSGNLLKWSFAALLVTNGGALVALIGSNELRTEGFRDAGLYFGGGMICALFGGMFLAIALGLMSGEGMRRGLAARPVGITDVLDLKVKHSTKVFTALGLVLWLGSFAAFGAGCVATAILPYTAELKRLDNEAFEATTRFVAEANRYLEVMRNPATTQEQRHTALDRVRAAQVEARIRMDRVNRTLGDPVEPLMTDNTTALPVGLQSR